MIYFRRMRDCMYRNYFYALLFFGNERKITFHAMTELNKSRRLSSIETIPLNHLKEPYCQLFMSTSDWRRHSQWSCDFEMLCYSKHSDIACMHLYKHACDDSEIYDYWLYIHTFEFSTMCRYPTIAIGEL